MKVVCCVCVCMWLAQQNKTSRPAAFLRYSHLHQDVLPNYCRVLLWHLPFEIVVDLTHVNVYVCVRDVPV